MKRNMKLYLQDIWESILAIEEYTQNLSEDEFYSKKKVGSGLAISLFLSTLYIHNTVCM